jgi:energy-converting hydrogenase Eha subunit G
MKNLGISLIVIGVIMTAFTGFNVVTKKKVVDLGAVEITSDEKTPIYWSPITGGILAAAGIILFVASRKKS